MLGVRHHGPGSARSLREELTRLKPDIVLIEGPPEADDLVGLAADPELLPPVALLAHVPGESSKAAFWPFAVFSPEWQAIRHAVETAVPVRFCDMPAAHSLAAAPGEDEAPAVRTDPIGALARAAGYDDPERWWEDAVEHRGDTPFQVIAEAMAEVRDGHVPDEEEARREAFMRRAIRTAVREGFERIAVVCGAWHVPALAGSREGAWGAGLPTAKADDALLRGLPKVKVETTWVPWTYGRLAAWSGYGAGVTSPGWYHHLFSAPDRPVERWLTEGAATLRAEDLPVSSAHVIEAVRLAHSLATLRGRPLAGLAEATEAVRAVLCEGDDLPVELVQRRMVVGERLGAVPESTPMVPLQRHLRQEQRRVRLKPEALDREYDLDLRKPLDLERSRLLHRLRLLDIGWGTPRESRGKGTFRESWTLTWRPEFDVELIEAGVWGTTVSTAAVARVRDLARGGQEGREVPLATLTGLVERCLLADLPDALPYVIGVLSERAALDGDVTHLMAAFPAMVRAQRYGDVRATPAEGLAAVADAMLTRICLGFGGAASGLDEDAARDLLKHVDAVHAAVALLQDAPAPEESPSGRWLGALRGVSGRSGLPGVIEGRLTRILLDAGDLDTGQVGAAMARAMSAGHPPARAAAWVEGFLSGGGLLLVHDARLLALVDDWLTGLAPETFVDVLPLLRRTFGAFAAPERRSIGSRVRSFGTRQDTAETGDAEEIDEERAAGVTRTVLALLGRTEIA